MISLNQRAGRPGGIMQQVLSGRGGRPGRQQNGGMIASGRPIEHGGRIAGGAPQIPNPAFVSVFAPIVYRSPLPAGAAPGGLIDRAQQMDPKKTLFGHPFAGGNYLSISSQQLLPALGHWNGFITTMNDVPNVQPHERGKFFFRKIVPPVKTQFGTRQSGPRPDTAFQRRPKPQVMHPQVRSSPPTEHVSRNYRPPSFESFNHLTSSASNFNTLYGQGGRWGNLKRSAQEYT